MFSDIIKRNGQMVTVAVFVQTLLIIYMCICIHTQIYVERTHFRGLNDSQTTDVLVSSDPFECTDWLHPACF